MDFSKSFELLFELENISNNQIWNDDRIEDNYYSYSFNIPSDINLSVFYNDIDSKNSISTILEAFKINTESIDSSFYKIEYYLTEGLQRYSNIDDNKNIFLFLGYDIFENTNYDIISNFLNK